MESPFSSSYLQVQYYRRIGTVLLFPGSFFPQPPELQPLEVSPGKKTRHSVLSKLQPVAPWGSPTAKLPFKLWLQVLRS